MIPKLRKHFYEKIKSYLSFVFLDWQILNFFIFILSLIFFNNINNRIFVNFVLRNLLIFFVILQNNNSLYIRIVICCYVRIYIIIIYIVLTVLTVLPTRFATQNWRFLSSEISSEMSSGRYSVFFVCWKIVFGLGCGFQGIFMLMITAFFAIFLVHFWRQNDMQICIQNVIIFEHFFCIFFIIFCCKIAVIFDIILVVFFTQIC